jgi:hypothetical protein
VFVVSYLTGKRSLDCEPSNIGDRPTQTKEEPSAQISLRLSQFCKKERERERDVCKVKYRPEIRYSVTDKVNELGTKKLCFVNLRKGIRSCPSKCCLQTGRLIRKYNVLL